MLVRMTSTPCKDSGGIADTAVRNEMHCFYSEVNPTLQYAIIYLINTSENIACARFREISPGISISFLGV